MTIPGGRGEMLSNEQGVRGGAMRFGSQDENANSSEESEGTTENHNSEFPKKGFREA